MNRLSVKRLTSIGAVEEGDNPPAEIVLFKHKPDPVSGTLPVISPDRAPDGDTDMSDLDLSALEEELRAEIEKQFAGYEERIAELEKDQPVDVTKGMSDEARALFESLEKKAADQAAALEKERDARLTVEWVGKARAFEKVLGDAEEAAPHLKSLDEGTAEWLLEKLANVEKALEASDLFKELGSSDDDSSAADKIDALAKENLKANPELTMEQARVLVRKANPDLKRLEREGR
jgi:hypothetical protein